jgi:hypothetical protein
LQLAIHSALSRVPDVRLCEEDIVIGTILALENRSDIPMQECISDLVHDIRRKTLPESTKDAPPDLPGGKGWALSREKKGDYEFYDAEFRIGCVGSCAGSPGAVERIVHTTSLRSL